jgi:hypothetical protein
MTLWGLVLAMTNPHRLKPVLLNPRNGFEDFCMMVALCFAANDFGCVFVLAY